MNTDTEALVFAGSMLAIPVVAVSLMFGLMCCEAAENRRYAAIEKASIKVTAYCPGACCCGEFADGTTASGRPAYAADGCAVDPYAIPYGSHIVFDNTVLEADDTGQAMRDAWRKEGVYHIDIRFGTHEEALAWGVREVSATIYRPAM